MVTAYFGEYIVEAAVAEYQIALPPGSESGNILSLQGLEFSTAVKYELLSSCKLTLSGGLHFDDAFLYGSYDLFGFEFDDYAEKDASYAAVLGHMTQFLELCLTRRKGLFPGLSGRF